MPMMYQHHDHFPNPQARVEFCVGACRGAELHGEQIVADRFHSYDPNDPYQFATFRMFHEEYIRNQSRILHRFQDQKLGLLFDHKKPRMMERDVTWETI